MPKKSRRKPSATQAATRANTLASRAGLTFLFLAAALVLLILGFFLPLMDVTKLFIFTDEVSIHSGIVLLYENEEYLLATVLLVFSFLFPLAKILCGLGVLVLGRAVGPRLLEMLAFLGKWSMLDVFMVGVFIISIKSKYLADATTEAGLYCFTAAILLSIVGTHMLLKRARG